MTFLHRKPCHYPWTHYIVSFHAAKGETLSSAVPGGSWPPLDRHVGNQGDDCTGQVFLLRQGRLFPGQQVSALGLEPSL